MITDRAECPRRTCDEAGFHATHRLYMTSIEGRGRAAGMIGVNLVQDDRPGAAIRVEITSSNVDQGLPTALDPDAAAALAAALVSAAAKARKLSDHDDEHVTAGLSLVTS
jgi:hypothetical protein